MNIVFDRIKDDPCYGCKHAVLKDIDRCAIFERLYLCKNRKILEEEIALLKREIEKIDPKESLEKINSRMAGLNLCVSTLYTMLDECSQQYDLSRNEFAIEPNFFCSHKEE